MGKQNTERQSKKHSGESERERGRERERERERGRDGVGSNCTAASCTQLLPAQVIQLDMGIWEWGSRRCSSGDGTSTEIYSGCNYISSFLTFVSLVLREAKLKVDAITSDKFSSTLIFW